MSKDRDKALASAALGKAQGHLAKLMSYGDTSATAKMANDFWEQIERMRFRLMRPARWDDKKKES